MWESSKRKSLDDFDHDGSSNDIDPPEAIEEMFWPSFDKLAKHKKIYEAGMYISYGVWAIIIAIEMM